MSTQTKRKDEEDGQLVLPLTDPSDVPAFAKAKRRWAKPLDILVAETLAHERVLLRRLNPGIWAPPIVEDYERNSEIYRALVRHTPEQITALETFLTVEWMEAHD